MDAITYISVRNIPRELVIKLANRPAIRDEDDALLKRYCRLNRHVIEIEQLFSIFEWNYHVYATAIKRNASDTIGFHLPVDDSRIVVNALTSNLISSAKTLVDRLDASYSDFDEVGTFVKHHEVYDRHDAYFILYELRNCCQHGQLIVSTADGRFGFDALQLQNCIKFNISNRLKRFFEEFCESIEKQGGKPIIAFTITMERFNIELFEIYLDFIVKAKTAVRLLTKEIEQLLSMAPSLIFEYKGNKYLAFGDCADVQLCHFEHDYLLSYLSDMEYAASSKLMNYQADFDKNIKPSHMKIISQMPPFQ